MNYSKLLFGTVPFPGQVRQFSCCDTFQTWNHRTGVKPDLNDELV